MEKKKEIPINIWDDFYDDGYVPDAEIQETFMYVESDMYSLEEQHKILRIIGNALIMYYLPMNVQMKLEFYDSKTKYPNLDEIYQSQRWKIVFKHLTHKQLDKMLTDLQNSDLTYQDGTPFKFYSQS